MPPRTPNPATTRWNWSDMTCSPNSPPRPALANTDTPSAAVDAPIWPWTWPTTSTTTPTKTSGPSCAWRTTAPWSATGRPPAGAEPGSSTSPCASTALWSTTGARRDSPWPTTGFTAGSMRPMASPKWPAATCAAGSISANWKRESNWASAWDSPPSTPVEPWPTSSTRRP